ncbi:hypothetical protein DH2020_012458 [Rehmannia glutinosa]|uniref:GRF-type domain-containing protein n=1 Tax=Rehmannia glutinosa TaxID=99300 RepID=A0ABR0X2H3_REHGL
MSSSNSPSFSESSSSNFRGRGANKHTAPITCYCGCSLRVQTSWTKANPGRRFMSCPIRGMNKCGYFVWLDPELSDRSTDIIVGLVEKWKTTKEKLAKSNERVRLLMSLQSVHGS